MLSLLTQSISNASIGIYFPKFTGTIFELLSAPISSMEMVIGYVGAAATKSVILGLIILATAAAFVPMPIAHPFAMVAFLILTSLAFSLFGFIIGVWAKGFEQLNFVPALLITPLTFLGGAFYSIDMLPAAVAHGQPVQPGRLSRQRLPLELLRQGRRAGGDQPGRYRRVPAAVPRGDRVDFPNRLSAEELILLRGGRQPARRAALTRLTASQRSSYITAGRSSTPNKPAASP